jgi:hypothetical protein
LNSEPSALLKPTSVVPAPFTPYERTLPETVRPPEWVEILDPGDGGRAGPERAGDGVEVLVGRYWHDITPLLSNDAWTPAGDVRRGGAHHPKIKSLCSMLARETRVPSAASLL